MGWHHGVSAQSVPREAVKQSNTPVTEDPKPQDIIVTGTILPATQRETPSPVTVITANDLSRRGITAVTEATQLLAANGSGTLPNSFSANGAFAAGAAAPSLRGLTTDSTLILFDGLRAAYYPLADDAVRNFVDTNTVPDAIIDRIEVLKDGASSTYGADAVAGVINIIFKRQIVGFTGTVESGISKYGDAAHQHLAATYGWGDLERQPLNAYLSVEYQSHAALRNNERGFPYNTANYSRLVGRDADGNIVNGSNGNINGLNASGFFLGSVPIAEVAPATATGTQAPGTFFEPIKGACGPYTAHPAADLSDGIDTVCEYDQVQQNGEIEPQQRQFGVTGHLAAKFGGRAEAYAMVTYYQSWTRSTGTPSSIRGTTDDGYSTTQIVLPAVLTAGASAGQLNPNDPFAASGLGALIRYRIGDIPNLSTQLNRTWRAAAGIKGSFGDNWSYAVDATGMMSNLTSTLLGRVYIAGLLSVVADGSYNFLDPSQNSQAVRNRIAPPLIARASSSLYQAQANLTKTVVHLQGGYLNVGIGAQVRYEGVDDPSANPQPKDDLTQQYFGVSRFGAIGHRLVESSYIEVDAPLLRQVEVDASGRYDHYSTGLGHFSPKIGVKMLPIPQLAFRATWSQGFRVPSFAETAQLPTVYFNGYVPSVTSYFDLQHLAANGRPDVYAQSSVLVNIIAGNAALRPEISRNITAGVVLSPVRWLNMSLDYYNIRKNDVIINADPTAAIIAYYNNQPLPAGFTVVADEPDTEHPNALPRLLSIRDSFVNAQSLQTAGLDFAAQIRLPIGPHVRWSSRLDLNYLLQFDEILPNGDRLRFAGTLGPIGISAASGSPGWHGNWQNTVSFGRLEATATAYYTSGYRTTSEDTSGPGTAGDCTQIYQGYYDDGVTPIVCRTHHFLDVDLNIGYQITPAMKMYGTVRNLANARAPFDPVTYGGNGYNPSWAEAGVVGRYFEIGFKVTL
jgi:iron complex outermembrane receptor protein